MSEWVAMVGASSSSSGASGASRRGLATTVNGVESGIGLALWQTRKNVIDAIKLSGWHTNAAVPLPLRWIRSQELFMWSSVIAVSTQDSFKRSSGSPARTNLAEGTRELLVPVFSEDLSLICHREE